MSILDAPLARLDGTEGTLRDLTGDRAALLVNVASRCGLTSQYAGLEQLHETYAGQGFTVVGLPCNQFGGQEPGDADEIATFCSATYGVTFPMSEKIEVNGPSRHPVYEELTREDDTIAAVRVLKSSVSVAPEPADWARLTSETSLAIAGMGG